MKLTSLSLLLTSFVAKGLKTEVDPNGSLFQHMIPIFRSEEAQNIKSLKVPVLGGETVGSLAEAVSQVRDMESKGLVQRQLAGKLIQTLEAVEEIRRVASLMDGSRN